MNILSYDIHSFPAFHSRSNIHPLLFGVFLKHREMATEGTAGQVCDTGREVRHGSRLTSEVHFFLRRESGTGI